uniref:Uncharacterized protein n=1 Tax=Phanerochaete carnosa TaxID=231932 RepID=A0A895KXG6_9APHY|nr:hypothetical protein K8K84_mgp038 [Phanerochaete carnosa]QRZ60414.1 hypothetical protein [Phanerochaete carnosa]
MNPSYHSSDNIYENVRLRNAEGAFGKVPKVDPVIPEQEDVTGWKSHVRGETPTGSPTNSLSSLDSPSRSTAKTTQNVDKNVTSEKVEPKVSEKAEPAVPKVAEKGEPVVTKTEVKTEPTSSSVRPSDNEESNASVANKLNQPSVSGEDPWQSAKEAKTSGSKYKESLGEPLPRAAESVDATPKQRVSNINSPFEDWWEQNTTSFKLSGRRNVWFYWTSDAYLWYCYCYIFGFNTLDSVIVQVFNLPSIVSPFKQAKLLIYINPFCQSVVL